MKPEAALVVDTDAPSVAYSPMIFGGFLEHFHNEVYGGVFDPGSPRADRSGFRKDVIRALKELKVPVVRWPGGCYVDGYRWQDGVGKSRAAGDDIVWGVRDPHTFGTDEFVKLSRLAGWEPYICNNGHSAVQEMKDWVEYCNLADGPLAGMRRTNGCARPHVVKFWSVGNETYNPEFAQKVRDAAKGMKAVDPAIEVTCPALPESDKTVPLLKTAGDYLNYISIHWYWIPNWQEFHRPDYLTCMMESEDPESWITRSIASIEQAGYRGRIKIAFDEWNLRSWHHPGFPRNEKVDYADPRIIELVKARDKSNDPALYTMADALFAASFFNACLRHAEDVGMANVAPLVNHSGPLYVYPGGIVKRTHFHAMAMYANELEARVGKSDMRAEKVAHNGKSVAAVDAVATVDKSGRKWAIALVNRHPEKEITCSVTMKDRPLEGKYKATILSGDSPDAYNDAEHPCRVAPKETRLTFAKGVTTLPPHSLVIVKWTQR